LFILLIIKSVGSKNISFISLKSNISKNLTITTKIFLRGLHVVNCTAKLFSYLANNVKNGKNN